MMKVNSTIFFTIISFFYSLLLFVVYFSREKIKTPENRIYSKLIIINFIGIILELLCCIFADKALEYMMIYTIINKLFLLYLIVWCSVFGVYVFLISANIEERKMLKKYMYRVIYLYIFLDVLFGILIFSLPVEFNFVDGVVMYSYGTATNIVYIGSLIYIALMVVCLIKNFKNIKSKKYLPIFVYLLFGVCVGILQKMHPEILAFTSMEAFVTVLMYFTIENPDMKLLKEMHEAKEISDNANEEKTLFLYNMTQEIRTTTKNIDNEADNIIDSDDIEFDRESARNIKGETSKFRMMTNDILDVSAIDSANIKIYNSSYNLKILLRSIIGSYTEVCNNKNLEFRTNIEHNIPESLYGDNISLKRAINLLLTYSVKCTKRGYVELDINTIKKGDIVRLIITIEDSSMGIKSSELEKIKIDNKSISECYKLVILMNGTMVITSNYGIGNKIKIILDQKIDKDINKEEKKYQEILLDKKILVVDNNESSIKVIDKLLKGSKIEMDYSLNGKDAYNKIKTRNRYDLILIDEELNMMTGAELLKYLKEIRNFNIPVILLSKDNKYEYNEEYLKMGFNDILIKPIKKEVLIEKINKNIMNRVDILDRDKK